MRLNFKNKKVQLIIGVGVAIFIAGNLMWGKINNNLNDMVDAGSFIIGMHDINKDRKSLIMEAEKNMTEYKNLQIQTQAIIEELNEIEKLERKELDKDGSKYEDANLVNKTITIYNQLDQNIENLISLYETDEYAKKDRSLAISMDSIIENEYSIDKQSKDFNKIYRVKYNNAINSFPIKLIAEKKGWVNINELKIN
ncbi:hypothetical protein C672_0606 [[Clostridium] bifermentans ATCC 638]|uniref:LemA family protein n=1 Tax=Paraclostridium bifermentans ATCC 638 = DSM 14991 TaxID=1233171 RepID=T4VRF5_PARBF|nr:hypothetical protein [Paraclostridium bifermentans]EQK44078.1 hypothetical protein C672_0606 [[Clostridium] bifermentans ATCC 638] [Paraclostridium bifermentans ATCC 638 = DSM 14991]RIZ58519.1 hypothetical protein CHH45_10435 [Paraclostridium bifermentans]UAG19818.1 hypothetical protein KXZ80_16775 [Paraclostridium bifermentans]